MLNPNLHIQKLLFCFNYYEACLLMKGKMSILTDFELPLYPLYVSISVLGLNCVTVAHRLKEISRQDSMLKNKEHPKAIQSEKKAVKKAGVAKLSTRYSQDNQPVFFAFLSLLEHISRLHQISWVQYL